MNLEPVNLEPVNLEPLNLEPLNPEPPRTVTQPRAVLWDLDGTLVDSREHHWRAWRDTMAADGVTITYQQFLDSFGQKNDRILTAWLGSRATPPVIQRIGDAKETLYRDYARREGVQPLPGAIEWVRRLHAHGWRQVIASSAPRANVDVLLNALDVTSEIEAIVSAEDVERGKPDPEVFLTAASRVRVEPARCIVVEDAAAGIEAAQRAGMKSIGVSASVILSGDTFVRSLADLPTNGFDRLLRSRR